MCYKAKLGLNKRKSEKKGDLGRLSGRVTVLTISTLIKMFLLFISFYVYFIFILPDFNDSCLKQFS